MAAPVVPIKAPRTISAKFFPFTPFSIASLMPVISRTMPTVKTPSPKTMDFNAFILWIASTISIIRFVSFQAARAVATVAIRGSIALIFCLIASICFAKSSLYCLNISYWLKSTSPRMFPATPEPEPEPLEPFVGSMMFSSSNPIV